jgi:hypothetical protein
MYRQASRLLKRILELRALASATRLAKSEGFLLPRGGIQHHSTITPAMARRIEIWPTDRP